MMRTTPVTGNNVCYLGGRPSVADRVAQQPPMIDSSSSHRLPIEARWLVWTRSVLAIVVVAVLVALGIANVTMYSRWHEVEDGVLWGSRAEGVTAIDIASGSAAATAGIQRGDVLIAIDGSPIEKPGDVVEYEHGSGEGTR